MGKVSDDKTSIILRNLVLLFPTFYLLYYVFAIILVGSFSVDYNNLGEIPFNFNKFSFDVGQPLGNT
jgi:hypothetical protein